MAVICNGLRGLFHIAKQVMECRCRSCQAKVRQHMCMPCHMEHLSWQLRTSFWVPSQMLQFQVDARGTMGLESHVISF